MAIRYGSYPRSGHVAAQIVQVAMPQYIICRRAFVQADGTIGNYSESGEEDIKYSGRGIFMTQQEALDQLEKKEEYMQMSSQEKFKRDWEWL